MTLARMVFYSSAAAEMTPEVLARLEEQAGRNNASLGITGLLAFHEGNFLHVLEGEEEVVRRMVQRMMRDPRNTGVLVIQESRDTERAFSSWAFAYAQYDPLQAHAGGFGLDLPQAIRVHDERLFSQSESVGAFVTTFLAGFRTLPPVS